MIVVYRIRTVNLRLIGTLFVTKVTSRSIKKEKINVSKITLSMLLTEMRTKTIIAKIIILLKLSF